LSHSGINLALAEDEDMVFAEDLLAIGYWRWAIGVLDEELSPVLGLAVEVFASRRYDEGDGSVYAVKGVGIYLRWEDSLYGHAPNVGTPCEGMVAYLRNRSRDKNLREIATTFYHTLRDYLYLLREIECGELVTIAPCAIRQRGVSSIGEVKHLHGAAVIGDVLYGLVG
jgi:hypothetical protein